MFPIFNLGPLAIPVPQFSIIISLWLGLSLSEKFAQKNGVKPDDIYNLVFSALLSGIIGARLGYIINNMPAFIHTPLGIFSTNLGMMDPFMGFSFGILAIIIYINKKRVPLWSGLDSLVPLLSVICVGISISHIASGEFYGSVTKLPWGINLWGAVRHPSQFYELIFSLIILMICPFIFKAQNFPGRLFLIFTAFTASAGIFIDGFHGNSQTLIGGLRMLQIIYWIIVFLVFIILDRRTKKTKEEIVNG